VNRFVAIITALVTAFTLRCGTSGLAGAAGSGNPGGSAVSLAIVADGLRSGDGLGKHTVEPQQLRADLSAGLPIPDLDSMHFTADSMFVTVQRVRFVPAGDSTCARLIDAFPGDGLRCDSGSVNIDGPFTFNALTGECTPPLDSLPVPAAGYGAIRLETDGSLLLDHRAFGGPCADATARIRENMMGTAGLRVETRQ